MQSSKNSAFFTVLIMGKHFGQRILNSEDHTSLCLRYTIRSSEASNAICYKIYLFYFLKVFPSSSHYEGIHLMTLSQKSIHVQPLLMTEVEKILSSVTACTQIFSIVLSGFQQWRHMHFLFYQLAHGNKFVPAHSCSLKTSSSCSTRSKSDVSFLALLPPLGPPRFAHLDFVVHLLLLLQDRKKRWVIHPKIKRTLIVHPSAWKTK